MSSRMRSKAFLLAVVCSVPAVYAWWSGDAKDEGKVAPQAEASTPEMSPALAKAEAEKNQLPRGNNWGIFIPHPYDFNSSEKPADWDSREAEAIRKIWNKHREFQMSSTYETALNNLLAEIKKRCEELSDGGENDAPHSRVFFQEKPPPAPGGFDIFEEEARMKYIFEALPKFVIEITTAPPLPTVEASRSYKLRILLGAKEAHFPGNLKVISYSVQEPGKPPKNNYIICPEVESVLERVSEICKTGFMRADEITFLKFDPPSTWDTICSVGVLIVIVLALFSAFAACCCRGVFHYMLCRCFCSKKEPQKPKMDPRDAKRYPSVIPLRQAATSSARSATSRRATGMVPEPVQVQPMLAPDLDGPETPTLKCIKVVPREPMVVPENASGDLTSTMQSVEAVYPVPVGCTGISEEASSDIEIAEPITDASISAAVRSAARSPESSTNSEDIEVEMPENDASISAAVRRASSHSHGLY